MDVVNTADMTLDDHIERELLLIKVRVEHAAPQLVSNLIKTAGARVLDDTPETYTLELTASTGKVDTFIADLGGITEILAVVRSGAMAISQGQKVLNARV